MDFVEIGIVDSRKIIKAILDLYGFDLSEFALTSLKRRFEKIIVQFNLKNAENLIDKLTNDITFYEEFLSFLLVESTEMFRDPSLWRLLRDEFLPANLLSGKEYKIWLPLVVGGEELYALLIMLKEANLMDKVSVHASYLSIKCLENIQSGIFKANKIDVSTENYKRFQGHSVLTDYYSTDQNNQCWKDKALLENVQFTKLKELFEPVPRDINLILFRNQMIYYNQTLQDKVLKSMFKALSVRGHIIIGTKEHIPATSTPLFNLVNEAENIYKKKLI